jgi:hypothetical protein
MMAATRELFSAFMGGIHWRLLELVVGCVAYQRLYPHHWGIFAVLFLAPDISLLGYLRSASKASAVFYNLVHSYVLPLALGLLAWKLDSGLTGQLALIWLAHISFDRCLGFGLKFPESFRVTHIQRSEAIDLTALSGKT